ncbi:MAG: cellulase family glycosylhydrolase [Ruminococcus sp.]|nr:cellulase family glycosylhydrolase [Ruminococcus sp.]
MIIMKKLLSIAVTASLTVSTMPVSVNATENNGMRDISTMELVRDMGIGINLGNTLEACGDWIAEVDQQWGDGILTVTEYETAWGSPVITQEMIQGMADEGFGVVRVPVAWSNLMDENYKISEEYDNRVHEIVDWVIEADMYCIINIHWDNGWVNTFPDNRDECMKRYETMWTQIADSFKDYSDYLMFESQNEELGWESLWNPWGSDEGKTESYALVNEINQKFVDVIRNSGGNNPERHLLISGYNTGIDRTCDSLFRMPDDPANRMAVSVHYYTPAGFAILEEDADWGKAISTWGTEADFNELYYNMDMMKTNYIDKGIPVIIGEYGCPTTNKEPESVRLFISSVCKAAYERQLCPVLWATPGGHYDRDTCKMVDQQLKKLFNEVCDSSDKETNPPAEIIMGDVNSDGEYTVADIVLLGNWLLGREKALTNAKAADFNEDDVIDVFDLCLARYQLVKISSR